MSICLVIAVGIVAYVWASGCCGDDSALCNGGCVRIPETDCDWAFYVNHNVFDWGEGHTVWVYVKEVGGPVALRYLLNLVTPDPQPICMFFSNSVTLRPSNNYQFWFKAFVGDIEYDREPPGTAVFPLSLDADCNEE